MNRRQILSLIACVLVLNVITDAFAQETVRLAFQGAGTLSITEKADIRIRENGRYLGYLYKEMRGYFALRSAETLRSGAIEYVYDGTVYVLEDQKRNARLAKWIDEVYEIELSATDYGRYSTNSPAPYPRTRGFPVLIDRPLESGMSWREYGEQVVIPREGAKPTRIEFYCEFKYQGLGMYLEREVHVIHAQYATRYRRGQDPGGEPSLTRATGKHLVTIYIDTSGSGWMFMRDQVDEQFSFSDGMRREIEGFYLTWFEGAVPRDRESDALRIAEKLEEEGIEDVGVGEGDEGVTMTIQNIHFLPDQAVILPDERSRLDGIAEALKAVGDRTIKAVGHTADVGTQESQYELSVERAKAIIEEMVKRGLPPDRFIYEGKGGTEPLASNDTEEGRAQNRRVEFVILDN